MSSTFRILTALTLALVGPAPVAQVPLEGMPIWSTSEQGIYSTGMIWRDCNNDGVTDGFFANGNDIVQAANNIYLFGGGTPPVSASWYSSDYEYSGHCAVGDIDDNGFPDFIVANYLGVGFGHPNRSNLYLNHTGLPEVSPSWRTPDEIFSFSCALGDIDNDGDLDIAFATGDGYYLDYQADIVYRNDDGSFAETIHWSSDAATAAVDVTWGDVDKDGDLDLALTYDRIPTAVYYNTGGTLETTPSWQASTAESGNTLIFADINGDTWLDLVVAYNNQLNGSGYFRVYFNDGAGNLDPVPGWASATGGYGSALAAYDYDHDGDRDLAAGRWFNELFVYENTGTTLTTGPVWTTAIEMVAEELAWVDIDGGGVLDLADTIPGDGGTKLFYTRHDPLYAIDSVFSDGTRLLNAEYCYDLVSGWLSLAEAPASELICWYRYSFKNDLAVSCWDTVNMVFGNTSPPFVDASAGNTFGPAPLAVQFTDASVGAYEWSWDFGDGETSEEQSPLHVYDEPGIFDVEISVTTPEREYRRMMVDLVSAYADSLIMPNAEIDFGWVRVDVYAHNFLPLSEIIMPFTWDGPLEIGYDSFSVNGLRTEYFDAVNLISIVPSWKSATMRLATGTQPALAPGEGPVVSLYFSQEGGISEGFNPIAFTSYGSYAPLLVSQAGSYPPHTIDGELALDCCSGRVGDANNQGGDEPSIGDVSILIDMLFISFMELDCWAEADINKTGGTSPGRSDITIGDISYLIDYLFITGAELGLPDCP
jgi:PKD repeat protein